MERKRGSTISNEKRTNILGKILILFAGLLAILAILYLLMQFVNFIPESILWLLCSLVIVAVLYRFYAQNKPKGEERGERFIKLGKVRKMRLASYFKSADILDKRYSDYELGSMSKEKFEELEAGIESHLKESEGKEKEMGTETGKILTRVMKHRHEELEGLAEEQKEYEIKKWEEEIADFFVAGNKPEEIVAFMCGNSGIKLKMNAALGEQNLSQAHKDKIEKITESLTTYQTDRIVRDERTFETTIYEYLKSEFKSYTLEFLKKIGNGHVDILVDNDLAIALAIADSTENLNALSAKMNRYKEAFDKVLVVILDINHVMGLKDYTEKFESVGATVLVLTDKNIRFRKSMWGHRW